MPDGKHFDFVIIAGHGDSLVTFRGDLLRALRARGQTVLALAPAMSAAAERWLTTEGITYAEAPLSRTGTGVVDDLRFLTWLVPTIRSASPSAILAYTVKPVVYGMLASRFSSARRYAMITGLGYAFTDGRGDRKRLQALVRMLYRLALRDVDTVFFHNRDDEAVFRDQRLIGRSTPSMVVAGSGVNIEQYAVATLSSATTTFLLIARLLGDKGVREYVAAVRELKRSHPQVVGRLAGWIDSNPDAITQDELDGWVTEGVIEFLGKLEDVRPAIAGCTVYVLPSYREGTPRTVLEAMSMGRAIITTDAPGCRDTVVEGDNGFLVPPQSVEALRAAMERFVVEPALADRMGRRSRAIVEQKYDAREVSAAMLGTMGIH